MYRIVCYQDDERSKWEEYGSKTLQESTKDYHPIPYHVRCTQNCNFWCAHLALVAYLNFMFLWEWVKFAFAKMVFPLLHWPFYDATWEEQWLQNRSVLIWHFECFWQLKILQGNYRHRVNSKDICSIMADRAKLYSNEHGDFDLHSGKQMLTPAQQNENNQETVIQLNLLVWNLCRSTSWLKARILVMKLSCGIFILISYK